MINEGDIVVVRTDTGECLMGEFLGQNENALVMIHVIRIDLSSESGYPTMCPVLAFPFFKDAKMMIRFDRVSCLEKPSEFYEQYYDMAWDELSELEDSRQEKLTAHIQKKMEADLVRSTGLASYVSGDPNNIQ